MKQKKLKMIKFALLMGAGVFAASQASADLIVNGSFETADLSTPSAGGGSAGQWNYFYNGSNPLYGWTSSDNNTPLEVGLGSIYGVTGYDGNNVMELDSTVNVAVDQSLVTAGGTYQLSFLYALRSGVDPSSGTMSVVWDGIPITLTPTSSAMTLYTATVTGASGNNTLEFDGTGTSDSYGAILDNVSLNAVAPVPEPTTVLAGALMLLPFGVGAIRSLRKERAA